MSVGRRRMATGRPQRLCCHRHLTILSLILFAALLIGCHTVVATHSPPPTQAAAPAARARIIPPAVSYQRASGGEAVAGEAGKRHPSQPPAFPTPHPTDANVQTLQRLNVPTFTPSHSQLLTPPPPTPQPTFTRPPAPQSVERDHYWFYRPVPEDTAVWTNKHYPYGSTRSGTLRTHAGVEFDVASGTPIMAANSGTVVFAGEDDVELYGEHLDFYGRLVVVVHDFTLDGQPVYTLYGHLSELLVSAGEKVAAGEVIARSGGTGVADGPHLHFEVRVGSNSYDATRNPLLWLYPFPGRGTVAGHVNWPDGQLAYEAPVALRRLDAPSSYHATTTYAADTVNRDENWDENFVLDDVTAGYYEVSVRNGDETYTETLWVYPAQTSFVEIVIRE